ncbi:MAG: EVE domain-containing protein [Methanomicrobia archaeon]|nr:EVE domain-containing protein [Methanomicrobia archaeon]
MTYWLCITNEANWQVVKQRNVWGVAERHRNTIAKVTPGDTLVMYLKQEKIGDEIRESRIAGVFTAASAVYTDKSKIFSTPKGMGNEPFPLRVKLKPVDIFKKPVAFKPLIPRLQFITNKKKWSGHLMGKAMRQISEEDFEVMVG